MLNIKAVSLKKEVCSLFFHQKSKEWMYSGDFCDLCDLCCQAIPGSPRVLQGRPKVFYNLMTFVLMSCSRPKAGSPILLGLSQSFSLNPVLNIISHSPEPIFMEEVNVLYKDMMSSFLKLNGVRGFELIVARKHFYKIVLYLNTP